MEILILSCGTGGGHDTAGQALADELQRRGHSVYFEDAYRLAGKKASSLVNDSYIKLVQRAPKVFGRIYSLGDAYRKLSIHSPVYWLNGKLADHVLQYIDAHHFDAIVMTHMFPAHMLSNLKERGAALPESILVATDYTCIPFAEESSCDYYVIPAPDLRERFTSVGIDETKLLPFGIPVRREFTQDTSRSDARKRLGLTDDRTYILLSGGSIGAGSITEAIRSLLPFLSEDEKRTLIVVCGSNQRLYRQLVQRHADDPQMMVIGRTSQMAGYMKACDLFITKPGGLSSTEAAVCGIPLIHISPIPGCESCNINYFSSRDMSIPVNDLSKELIPALRTLQQRGGAAAKMRDAQRTAINRNATSDLCSFIERSHTQQQQ